MADYEPSPQGTHITILLTFALGELCRNFGFYPYLIMLDSLNSVR